MSLILTPTLSERLVATEANERYDIFAYHLTPGGVPIAGANWNLNGNYVAATEHALYIPPGKSLYLTSLTAMVRAAGPRPDRWGIAALTTGWALNLAKDWNTATEDNMSLNAGLLFNSWARFAAVARTVSELTLGAGDDYWMLTLPFGGPDMPFLPRLRGGRDTVTATIGPTDNLSGNTEVAWIARGLLF